MTDSKKNAAQRRGRVIAFIDEPGFSERLFRARTWASRHLTPILRYSLSWKLLSVIAWISLWRIYFWVPSGNIRTHELIEFLQSLQATISKKLLIIWDRRQTYRSKLARQYIDSQRGTIASYAPELNAIECTWRYFKHHVTLNYCIPDLGDLASHARLHLRSMRGRPTLLHVFG